MHNYVGEDPEEAVNERMRRLEQRERFSVVRAPHKGRTIEVRGNPTPSGGFVMSYTDVTEREEALARTHYLATHDVLTNLSNRMVFEETLRQAVADADHGGGRVGVLFLDLDRFKEVNDVLGHAVGDEVLRRFARHISAQMHPADTIARIGGDEFAVVVRSAPDREGMALLMNRLLERARECFRQGAVSPGVGLSIGAALYPDDTGRADDLLKYADIALYSAKTEGRNRWAFFRPEMERAVIDRMEMSKELAKAIERRELTLFFQPQFRAGGDRQLVGAEALLRWRHPERGFVRPDAFLSVAETAGMMPMIDDYVIHEALGHLQRLDRMNVPFGQMAINITPSRIFQAGFVDNLLRTMAGYGIQKNRVILEITESIMLADLTEAIDILDALRKNGVLIAIDDFGAGYSSFEYLRRLPVDHLKMDRALIANFPSDPRNQIVTRAIIEVGHGLGMEVVAEGVEMNEQRSGLAALGCDIIQGYLLGRPVPLDAFMTFYLPGHDAGRLAHR